MTSGTRSPTRIAPDIGSSESPPNRPSRPVPSPRIERHPFIASNWGFDDDQRATTRLVPSMNEISTC